MKIEENEQSECLTQSIEPQGINPTEYDIQFEHDSEKITQVSHKEFGPVEFRATKIDSNIGYVLGSTLQVYTQLV